MIYCIECRCPCERTHVLKLEGESGDDQQACACGRVWRAQRVAGVGDVLFRVFVHLPAPRVEIIDVDDTPEPSPTFLELTDEVTR